MVVNRTDDGLEHQENFQRELLVELLERWWWCDARTNMTFMEESSEENPAFGKLRFAKEHLNQPAAFYDGVKIYFFWQTSPTVNHWAEWIIFTLVLQTEAERL